MYAGRGFQNGIEDSFFLSTTQSWIASEARRIAANYCKVVDPFAKGNFEIIGQYYDVMEFAAM